MGHQTTNRHAKNDDVHLFDTAEEVWFWFIIAQQARNDGARFTAGLSAKTRPCEPTDILKIVDRLYRNRRLVRDHLLVLRHYGRRQMPPDARRPKEYIASKLWKEAMERIEPILIEKEIMHQKTSFTDRHFPFHETANTHNQQSAS